jgi:hypothetical protein
MNHYLMLYEISLYVLGNRCVSVGMLGEFMGEIVRDDFGFRGTYYFGYIVV